MHTFLEFIRRYSYGLLFLLLEAVSVWLLVSFNAYQGSVWFTAANSATARLAGLYTGGQQFLSLREVNGELTRRNIVLEQQNNALREELLRLRHDTTADSPTLRATLAGYKLIQAHVVSNSAERAYNYLVIDRGSADGVRPEMGVVAGTGAVGIVYLTAPHHALVIPATNRKSSISCRVRGANYFGSLGWDGKDFLSAYVDDVPRYADVKRGAIIETSGYSTVFPPGIFVGRVTKVENSSDGQSYRLDVRLGTDFANLRDVAVITTPYCAEIDSLRVQAQQLDSLDVNNRPVK